MPVKHAKRRTMRWRRKGRPAGSKVPLGSPLHRVRSKSVIQSTRMLMDELERVRKAHEDEETFELEDIEEDINRERGYEADKKMIENIEYILKREKMLPEGASIIIPAGGWINDSIEEGYWNYQVDFEVFDKNQNTILFVGTAYGSGIAPEKPNEVILQDMTVEVKPRG